MIERTIPTPTDQPAELTLVQILNELAHAGRIEPIPIEGSCWPRFQLVTIDNEPIAEITPGMMATLCNRRFVKAEEGKRGWPLTACGQQYLDRLQHELDVAARMWEASLFEYERARHRGCSENVAAGLLAIERAQWVLYHDKYHAWEEAHRTVFDRVRRNAEACCEMPEV